MTHQSTDAISRSDRVFVAAMAIVIATASAAIGAAWENHPSTNKVATKVSVAAPVKPQSSAPATDMVMIQLLAEHRCLSEALYYEARGEGANGQKAVAEVVFHRMNHGNYGHSICAVVYEGAGRPGCQFSFTCNGDLTRPKEQLAWRESEQLAARILTGEVQLRDATGGATNYHAVSVSPDWADTLKRTTQIGNHIFYRGTPHTRPS
jgi:spore germination cell wall hydrolase CwlJ-like protein